MKTRILLIDDNTSTLEKFVPALENLNFQVTIVATVDAGTDKLKNEEFDVVVLDLKTGEGILNFFEVSLVPPPKRVIVTSNSFEEVESCKYHKIISSFLPKPFAFAGLLREIEES